MQNEENVECIHYPLQNVNTSCCWQNKLFSENLQREIEIDKLFKYVAKHSLDKEKGIYNMEEATYAFLFIKLFLSSKRESIFRHNIFKKFYFVPPVLAFGPYVVDGSKMQIQGYI